MNLRATFREMCHQKHLIIFSERVAQGDEHHQPHFSVTFARRNSHDMTFLSRSTRNNSRKDKCASSGGKQRKNCITSFEFHCGSRVL